MVFDMIDSVLQFSPGETRTAEELQTAGCDIAWLQKAGAIRPVGFLSAGTPRTDEEHAKLTAELQLKIEEAEDAREKMRQELKIAQTRIAGLEQAHREGARTLREAAEENASLRTRLAKYEFIKAG